MTDLCLLTIELPKCPYLENLAVSVNPHCARSVVFVHNLARQFSNGMEETTTPPPSPAVDQNPSKAVTMMECFRR